MLKAQGWFCSPGEVFEPGAFCVCNGSQELDFIFRGLWSELGFSVFQKPLEVTLGEG
jgi:hypothetical protein